MRRWTAMKNRPNFQVVLFIGSVVAFSLFLVLVSAYRPVTYDPNPNLLVAGLPLLILVLMGFSMLYPGTKQQ
jgi:uncharacterized Tic20 family protein